MRDAEARFSDRQVDLVCFEVTGRLYALEVGQVREIVRDCEATPLPKAPALIEGVVDLRGAVVPILDLGRALDGLPVEAGSTQARILVVEVDGLVLGLRVGAAVDAISLPMEALEDPPALATQAGYDAVRAVVRRPGAAPILVLSLDPILESVFRSAIGSDSHPTQGVA